MKLDWLRIDHENSNQKKHRDDAKKKSKKEHVDVDEYVNQSIHQPLSMHHPTAHGKHTQVDRELVQHELEDRTDFQKEIPFIQYFVA